MTTRRRALVVGGGITGLAAAEALSADGSTEVELWEAGTRLGGKIASSRFAGVDGVDEGADAFLRRVPHALELARRVGLDELTGPTDATAAVWHDGLHDLPAGILLGIPAALRPLLATDLLSWRGKLRAAAEPFLPRTEPDDTLGALVRARFGAEVHERLVDALVGSIYATDTDRSSLAAVPQLAEIANAHRSLLLGARRVRRQATSAASDEPIFAAPRQGMGSLVAAVAGELRRRGVAIATGRAASTIEADGAGWRVDGAAFESVLVTTPGRAAAPLLAGAAPDAAEILGGFEHADVIIVRLAIAAGDWPDRLRGRSGYLVPKPDQGFVTACSFGSQKWSHWRPADGGQILRVSLGRDGLAVSHLDDEAVVTATIAEVGTHLGLDLQPTELDITRWPGAFPQYRPHHPRRVAELEATLPAGLGVAGASYHGVGVPACIADARRAAGRVSGASATAGGSLT